MADKLDQLTKANSGSYPDRMAQLGAGNANATDELLSALVQLQKDNKSLQDQRRDLPTMKDDLTSIPGLITLLLAGGAGAFGGQAGAEAGATAIGSFLKGGRAKAAREDKLLEDQLDRSQEMLNAAQQRLSTMLTNRPDMFVDPGTGLSVVDPRALGIATTGLPLPINPAVSYHLTRQTNNQRLAVNAGVQLMLQGDTALKRKQGAMLLNTAIGVGPGGKPVITDDLISSMAGQDDMGIWTTLLSNRQLDPQNTKDAMVYFYQNGLSFDSGDPESIASVIEMLAPDLSRGGEIDIPDRVLQLVGEFNRYFREAGPDVATNLNLEEKAQLVWGVQREGDKALFLKHFLGDDAFNTGISGKQMLNLLERNTETDKMMWNMMAAGGKDPATQPWFKERGITSINDIDMRAADNLAGTVARIKNAEADLFAHDKGNKLRIIAGMLATQNPEASFNEVMTTANRVMTDLQDKATNQQTGVVDVREFNRLINEWQKGGSNAGPQ